jgi:hypothetical protein
MMRVRNWRPRGWPWLLVHRWPWKRRSLLSGAPRTTRCLGSSSVRRHAGSGVDDDTRPVLLGAAGLRRVRVPGRPLEELGSTARTSRCRPSGKGRWSPGLRGRGDRHERGSTGSRRVRSTREASTGSRTTSPARVVRRLEPVGGHGGEGVLRRGRQPRRADRRLLETSADLPPVYLEALPPAFIERVAIDAKADGAFAMDVFWAATRRGPGA